MRLLILFEDLDAKLNYLTKILLGKKSVWLKQQLTASKADPTQPISPELMTKLQNNAVEAVKSAAQWDPTNKREIDGMYLQFIVRDISNGKIRLPEDGPPLKESLEIFNKASKKGSWTSKKDIMQFSDWRELQRSTMEWSEKNQTEGGLPSSETEWVKRAKAGSEKITEFDITTTGGKDPGRKHYVVVQLTTPVAVTVYGRGTQWCTSCSLFKTIRPNELESTLNSLTSMRSQTAEGNPWASVDRAGFMEIIKELNDGD